MENTILKILEVLTVNRLLRNVLSLSLAFTIGAVVILIIGSNPIEAYIALFQGAFGNPSRIGETLLRTSPILLTALCYQIGAKAQLFNLGGEGAMWMGAIIVSLVAIIIPTIIPSFLAVPFLYLLAFLAGAAWMFIPAILRAKLNVNETITTVLLNYIPPLLGGYITYSAMSETWGAVTPLIPFSYRLPVIIPQTRFHAGFFLAIIVAFALYVFMEKMTQGYELKAVGYGANAAAAGGIDIQRIILFALCVGGGLAGLAGADIILGIHWRLIPIISPGFAWSGIAASVLGGDNPIFTIFSSFLFSGLTVGAEFMQRGAGVPLSVSALLQGVLIVTVIGGELIARKVGLK